ncbi:MAG: hypothetical protein J6A69_10410 [Clostridia bacterium]|nr:hypothetical protein [Clostridia bacterium]
MAQLDKLELLLPVGLKTELKRIAKEKDKDINEILCDAIRFYVGKEKKKNYKEELKKGYLEMAQINSAYAEMCLDADNECLSACEEKLSESELSGC